MDGSINVLGAIGMTLNGIEVRFTDRRQRILLAALVLERHLVEKSRLAGYLWPEDAMPGDPDNALQGHVRRLRIALEKAAAGGDKLLTTVHGIGYRLRFEPQSVDYYRFQRLKQQAEILFEHDAAAGVKLAREALSQWKDASGLRGGVLFENMPQLEAKAESIRQEYQSLLVACLDGELRCGRHRQVLTELVSLSEHDEYGMEHQELARLRMLAHYRVGPKDDAFAVFDRLRATLNTKYGQDPDEETKALKHQIARDAPELKAPEPEAAELEVTEPRMTEQTLEQQKAEPSHLTFNNRNTGENHRYYQGQSITVSEGPESK